MWNIAIIIQESIADYKDMRPHLTGLIKLKA